MVRITGGVTVCEGRRFCEGLEVRDVWCPCVSASRRVGCTRVSCPGLRLGYEGTCALSFRAFGLVSVSFAFWFRACVLSEVEICT